MKRGSKPPLDLRGLIGADELFRLSGGKTRDPAVDAWLDDDSNALRAIARGWFERMRRCGDDVLELIHDGCPVACVADAPFAYVNTFTRHVNVGFFNGAELEDPSSLLQGTGKRMRHVKVASDRAVDAAALEKLIAAAYADIRARLAAEDAP